MIKILILNLSARRALHDWSFRDEGLVGPLGPISDPSLEEAFWGALGVAWPRRGSLLRYCFTVRSIVSLGWVSACFRSAVDLRVR